MRQRYLAASLTIALALTGTACGQVAEKAAEEAVERSTGADKVDISEDGVKVKTKDGTFETGTAAEIPEDLPKAPLFVDSTLQSSTKLTSNGDTTWLLNGVVKDAKTAYRTMVKDLKAAGWEINSETESSSPEFSGIVSATKGDLDLNLGTNGGSEQTFYYWMTKKAG
jgi:hypothetical protein